MAYERTSLGSDENSTVVGLLYIEPKLPVGKTVDHDWYVAKMTEAMKRVKQTGLFYKSNNTFGLDMAARGFHVCSCGAQSNNRDFLVSVSPRPVVTNSLCIHYLRDHPAEVPESDYEIIWDMELLPE
jgi:hypothetical protein